MLIHSSTISENIIHVWMPLAGQSARFILEKLGYLEQFKDRIYIDSDYSGPSKSWTDQVSRRAILHEECLRVNVKFNANPTSIKWDSTTPGAHMDPAVHRGDTFQTKPLFFDPCTNIHITERYIPCNIEMECSLSFTDKVQAFDACTRMVSTFVRGELLTVSNYSYDYAFPIDVLNSLYQLGQMKGIPKGKYMDWISECSDNQIQLIQSTNTLVADRVRKEMVVRKDIYEVLCAVDYSVDQPATTSSGTSVDLITLNFNVTLQFGRVNMLYLKYPLVVNNKFVPENLVRIEENDQYGRLVRHTKHPYCNLDGGIQENKFIQRLPVRAPHYDNWHLPHNSLHSSIKANPFYIGVFTFDNENCACCKHCECTVDCPNKYTSINLSTDLAPYSLTDKVLAHYKQHGATCLSPLEPYSVSVFANNTQIDIKALRFDGTTLSIPNRFCDKKVYRIVLCKTPPQLGGVDSWFRVMDCIIQINK